MHPDIVIELARQRVAERAERPFTRSPSVPAPRSRPTLRTRLGLSLVRWGHRLAPPPRTDGALERSSAVRREPHGAATMGS